MIKRIIAILAATASIVVLCGFKGQTTTTSGPTYSYMTNTDIQNPVEQETDWAFPADQSLWKINPTRCAWDVDDRWQKYASGTLAAGASLTTQDCVIASPTSYYRTVYGTYGSWSQSTGFMSVLVTAPTSALTVSICYTPGRCFTAKPLWVAAENQYHYNVCVRSQLSPSDPNLTEIPGSQGGIGMMQTVVTTVTNPTSRSVRSMTSNAQALTAGIYDGGCPAGVTYSTDYPYTYYTG